MALSDAKTRTVPREELHPLPSLLDGAEIERAVRALSRRDRIAFAVGLVRGQPAELVGWLAHSAPQERVDAIIHALEASPRTRGKWRTQLMQLFLAAEVECLRQARPEELGKEIIGQVAARRGVNERTIRSALKAQGISVRKRSGK